MLSQMAAQTAVIELLWSRAFPIIGGVFLVYWAFVGTVFSKLDVNKVGAFLLGNSLMLVLLAVFVVDSVTSVQPWRPLLDSAHLYPLFALPVSAELTGWVVSGEISLFTVVTLAYTLITGAFSAGFVLALCRRQNLTRSP